MDALTHDILHLSDLNDYNQGLENTKGDRVLRNQHRDNNVETINSPVLEKSTR